MPVIVVFLVLEQWGGHGLCVAGTSAALVLETRHVYTCLQGSFRKPHLGKKIVTGSLSIWHCFQRGVFSLFFPKYFIKGIFKCTEKLRKSYSELPSTFPPRFSSEHLLYLL